MHELFERTEMLLGTAAIKALQKSHVAVFGIGGVGGYAVEVLARSAVGSIDLFDNDIICKSNINRQIVATNSTIGLYKVDVAAKRIKDINPECKVKTFNMFYMPENANEVNLKDYDYVIDCVDTMTAKLELIKRCNENGVSLISCMGAANKLDATAFKVADIKQTKMDPLAKIIRKKLKKIGINSLKVVYSEEQPLKPITGIGQDNNNDSIKQTNNITKRRTTPASNAFVPATAGLIIGGEVVKDIIAK